MKLRLLRLVLSKRLRGDRPQTNSEINKMADYKIGSLIEKTYLSEVFKGKWTDGRDVVFKFQPKPTDKKMIIALGKISRLEHPNILLPFHSEIAKDKLIEVTNYLDWPILCNVEVANYFQVREISTQLLGALAYVHSQGIMHHDITERNIFVNHSSLKVKLFDFNVAREPYFLERGIDGMNDDAPEYRKGNCTIDYQYDVYQAGKVIKIISSKRERFEFDRIRAKLKPGMPEGLEEFIERATTPDRKVRYRDAQEMLEAFRGIEN